MLLESIKVLIPTHSHKGSKDEDSHAEMKFRLTLSSELIGAHPGAGLYTET